MSHAEQQTDESAMQIAKENAALKEQITYLTCQVKMIKENDERTNFYTGLPSWSVFQEIFNFLQKWLEVMYHRLNFLIKWPLREVIKENMPPTFKQLYPNCICIIDCSEIFIETPKKYEARSITYSNYKRHNIQLGF